MNDIKIYHSVWRSLLILFICIIAFIWDIYNLRLHGRLIFVCLICIPILLYQLVREHITKIPYLIIDEIGIKVRGLQNYDIYFSDIQSIRMRFYILIEIEFYEGHNKSRYQRIPSFGLTMSAKDIYQLVHDRLNQNTYRKGME